MAITQEQIDRLAIKLERELGSTILQALMAPDTEDILLNADGTLWVKSIGKGFSELGTMTPHAAAAAMGTIAAWRETVVNHDKPILETELPMDGSRFEGIMPPVVSNPVFAIRPRPKKIFTLDDYANAGILTNKDDPLNKSGRSASDFVQRVSGKSHEEIIKQAIAEHKTILVVGSTGSGKTTFVNACLHYMTECSPQDRILIIEDTVELQCHQKNHVQLRAFGGVSMLDCLKAAMRLKPIRIVVGEVRGHEALTLLKAWNTGHPGGVATVHANDALAGLKRMEALVAEGTQAPQQSLIAEAVDLVVFIDEDSNVNAGRKIREVITVEDWDAVNHRYVVEYL